VYLQLKTNKFISNSSCVVAH